MTVQRLRELGYSICANIALGGVDAKLGGKVLQNHSSEAHAWEHCREHYRESKKWP